MAPSLAAVLLAALVLPGFASAQPSAPVEPATQADVESLFFEPQTVHRTPKSQQTEEYTHSGKYNVVVDTEYIRWLWWPLILYLFWSMAYVCDIYFVRTIEVICERFQIPDDVAGATLMALGCNGPELALNTIAIFQPSDIGVGAVVGGEVFNVLVIIGTAVLATPHTYMPLKLCETAFFRDVLFYVISVALLYHSLQDGEVSRTDALTLLLGATIYIFVVLSSDHLRDCAASLGDVFHRARAWPRRISRRLSTGSVSALEVDDLHGTTVADVSSDHACDESLLGGVDEKHEADVKDWNMALKCHDPAEGSVLGIRADLRNRLMDRIHHFESRYMFLHDDKLFISTAVDPHLVNEMADDKHNQCNVDIDLVYDRDEEHVHGHHWHHGGLVNPPAFLDNLENNNDSPINSKDLSPKYEKSPKRKSSVDWGFQGPDIARLEHFADAPWEVIPFEDILYCERTLDPKHFNLHVDQRNYAMGQTITLEFSAGPHNAAVIDRWVEAFKAELIQQRRKSTDPPAFSAIKFFMEWLDWLKFPVKSLTKATIPDMDRAELQDRYPVAFFMSMVWLAVFAYCVVAACDGIHDTFGIPSNVLGFTVAAAGTSFPNVFSGITVARQGKAAMAVANALGANVQNVFLALAIPWTIQSVFISQGSFTLQVHGLTAAVLEILVTLLPIVLIFCCCSFSLPKWSGGLFLVVYVIYLVCALRQESTHCWLWPVSCTVPEDW